MESKNITIKHNLLRNQETRKDDCIVTIDLFDLSSEVFKSLDQLGFIDRLREVPQLGAIKITPKSLRKTRFDYIVIQLFYHEMIRKKLGDRSIISYSQRVNKSDFENINFKWIHKKEITVGEVIQILTIVYNIGHFYNTFTSSRAVIALAKENKDFYNLLIQEVKDPRFAKILDDILESNNYKRFHLLNSLIILEHCKINPSTTNLAKEIIYEYFSDGEKKINEKLSGAFKLFRKIRDLSFVAYDLQIANTPFVTDFGNEKAMLRFFKELVTYYNNREPANEIINSITKILSDLVYNSESNIIHYAMVSNQMVLKYNNSSSKNNKYYDYLLDKGSIFNSRYYQKNDYLIESPLKITFDNDDKDLAYTLYQACQKTAYVRAGYYTRYNGQVTVIVTLKKQCPNKPYTALKVLRLVLKIIQKTSNHTASDMRYLLATKFFLYYLFGERKLIIEPTIDPSICIICKRGATARVKEIQKLLKNNHGHPYEKYEAQYLVNRLEAETKNDIALMIPASTVIYHNNKNNEVFCELDGVIIFPNREKNQVMIIEAKDIARQPIKSFNQLSETLTKLQLKSDCFSVFQEKNNAYAQVSIENN